MTKANSVANGLGRRDFLKLSAAGGVAAAADFAGAAALKPLERWAKADEIKAVLLHLGHNMWCEWLPDDVKAEIAPRYRPNLVLRNKDDLWRRATDHMAARGLNMLVVDVGEGLVYPSHPELAIEGSWSPEKLRDEVVRLRGLGIEAIPKLNFSATHDGWLKHYHRMLTTPKYYEVVKDVIRDTAEVFGGPRFFHLGYDEETTGYAKNRNYFVMRTGDLWWHDFLYTVKCVEGCGARPWVWSDYGWHHDDYFTRCPKSVVQSDCYYDECNADFALDEKRNGHYHRLVEFDKLEKAGFDQIPCGTNWVGWQRKKDGVGADDVIGKLVRFCRPRIAKERLLGFLMAPWASCDTEENLKTNLRGIDLLADAVAACPA